MRRTVLAATLVAAGVTFSADAVLAGAQTLAADANGYINTVLEFVREHRSWAIPIIFALSFGESIAFISLILPFWAALVMIGAMFTGSVWDVVPIWAASSIGAAMGDWLSFWLGYHYADKIFGMWPLSKQPELREKGHSLFERWGSWAIWIARFSGPLRASVPIVAGAVRMGQWQFQIANWGSAFLWAAVLLAFGDVIGKAIAFASPYANQVIEWAYRLF